MLWRGLPLLPYFFENEETGGQVFTRHQSLLWRINDFSDFCFVLKSFQFFVVNNCVISQ